MSERVPGILGNRMGTEVRQLAESILGGANGDIICPSGEPFLPPRLEILIWFVVGEQGECTPPSSATSFVSPTWTPRTTGLAHRVLCAPLERAVVEGGILLPL